jgi:elongation factor Ts
MSTDITADMVKELRARTGIAVGKCKEALQLAGGDMEKAITELRKAGVAGAVKKQEREAKEGLIAIAENSTAVAFIEINAETDFVVKNQQFQSFAQAVAQEAAQTQPSSLEQFASQRYSKDSSITLEELRVHTIQSLGENILYRRLKLFKKQKGCSYGIYSHLGGKIATLVILEGAEGEEKLARDIGMHVVAEAPEFLSPEAVPESIKEQEREIARAQVKGKPAAILDKIVEGKLEAYYQQSCLLKQKYVRDPEVSVAQLVEKRSKEIGKPLKVQLFLRWQVGQE